MPPWWRSDVEVVGGHTAGSAVVHLIHHGTHYVLAGDECYLCANRTEQRPIGQIVDLKRNVAFLHRRPSIVVLPCHDPGTFTGDPEVGAKYCLHLWALDGATLIASALVTG